MSLDFLSEGKRAVIENIRRAVEAGDTFRKVELSDPKITDEDVGRVILPFDNRRESISARIRAFMARKLAEKMTAEVNKNTEIRGMDNARCVTGAAMITANHYNPTDSTPIRMLAYECEKRKKLHIIVQETNIFMEGMFGFLMKNCNTHPVSSNREYMVKNLRPALERMVADGAFILIYPEQEMWWNYKKPRALRDGAYHYAASFGIPVIPTFTEMVTEVGERDADGFLPVRHILHVMPPIYPDPALSVRENRVIMQKADMDARIAKYEEVYRIAYDVEFVPERDIAGIKADE